MLFIFTDSSPEKVMFTFEGRIFCSSFTNCFTWSTVSTMFAPILLDISKVNADLLFNRANFSGSLNVLLSWAISLNLIVFLSFTFIGVLKTSFRLSYKPGILITNLPSPVSRFPAETIWLLDLTKFNISFKFNP